MNQHPDGIYGEAQPTPPSPPHDTPTPEDAAIAKFRAEWLHNRGAPGGWLILTEGEVAVLKSEVARLTAANAALSKELEEYKADRLAINARDCALYSEYEQLRTLLHEAEGALAQVVQEAEDMRDCLIDRGISDETSDGIMDANDAIESARALLTKLRGVNPRSAGKGEA